MNQINNTKIMNTEKLSNENETEALNKHVVMQAGSEKQPYFQLSTNEFGKHWLFYKPSKGEEGKYSCWLPIDDEFYSAFDKLQKAALGSEAAVGQRSVGTVAEGWVATPKPKVPLEKRMDNLRKKLQERKSSGEQP